MFKIAITGNIASGKSQVEKILTEKGFIVYDSDNIAHDILNNITEFYGYDVFTNNKIDRQKLGKLVFSDINIKNKLESLIHPEVKSQILEIFNKHIKDRYVFISVPLLYETGFEKLFDIVILVTVDKNIQLERLMKRNNLSKKDALLRINSQIQQEKKTEKADFIICNNNSLADLQNQISCILEELTSNKKQ